MKTTHRSAILVVLPTLLLHSLQLIGLTSGLQQQQQQQYSSTTANLFARTSILVRDRSTCLWSAPVAAADDDDDNDDDSALLTILEDPTQLITYDWDEQFEELQSFMSQYGHCNFPQNPSIELEHNYPMLKRFCHDQRIDYSRLIRNKRTSKNRNIDGMTLFVFDRDIRCRRLEELGFEFEPRLARWYDHYHELIQYIDDYGGMGAILSDENLVLSNWVRRQRGRRRECKSYKKLSSSQIQLLDDIGFEWQSETNDELWNAKYEELVAFRNKHGHLLIKTDTPLYQWMCLQRLRSTIHRGKYTTLTDDQIRSLDAIDFPWKPYDAKWYAKYEELQRFQQKHGHLRVGKYSTLKLYNWSCVQQDKYREGLLSTEQIKLLDKIGFCWKRGTMEWPRMYSELVEYCNTHGHLRVDQDNDPELSDWMDIQRKRYHATAKREMLSDNQIEQLEDLHFCWSFDWRDRTWHEEYAEAVEFFKEHGHIRVIAEENPSLYNWVEMQGKRYNKVKGQKPLSEEELEMLEQIDFPFLEGQPRMAWNTMYAELERYLEEHGDRFPTSHKDDPNLNRWVRQQRHRYRCAFGYAPLSDEQRGVLESIDFPMYSSGQYGSRYEKYDKLVDFWKKHGHFFVDRRKDKPLYNWIDRQRQRYQKSSIRFPPLSKMEFYLLERIGFPWVSNRYETEWQETYQEVVEFIEARGRLPTISDDKKLYHWLWNQRKSSRYRDFSEFETQQLNKIGVLKQS